MADEDRPLKSGGGAGADAWLAQIMAAGEAPSENTDTSNKPTVTKKTFLQRKTNTLKKPFVVTDTHSNDTNNDTVEHKTNDNMDEKPILSKQNSMNNVVNTTPPLSKEPSMTTISSPPLSRIHSTHNDNIADSDAAPIQDSTSAFEKMMLAAMQAEQANPAPMSKQAQQRNAALQQKQAAAAAVETVQQPVTTPVNSNTDTTIDTAAMNGTVEPTATFDGPIQERIVHKDWKQRVAAYETMKSELDTVTDDTTSECIEKYAPFINKIVNDSSAPALDKGIDAVIRFIDTASIKHNASTYTTDIVTACITKCATMKLSTKSKCEELILLLIECNAANDMVTLLTTIGLEQKNPKIAPICIEWLNKALLQFGPAVIQYNTIQKILPKLFDSTNAALKQQATELCLTLHKYMGAIFKVGALGLKPAAEKDLNDKIVTTETGLQPTRAIRSKNSTKSTKSSTNDSTDKSAAPAVFDPLASIAAVDIIPKLSKNWCDLVVNEEKWQDRVTKLQELSTLANNTPKILVTNTMNDVTAALKKLLKGANASVILESVKCVAALCKSARKLYIQHAKQLFPLIIVLLKEKAASFKTQLNPALDTIYEYTVELNDVVDDIVSQLTDKVALTRTNACEYVTRCINNEKTNGKSMNNDTVKLLGTTLIKLITDADATVREAALIPTAALINLTTRKPFTTELDKLRDTEPKKYERLDKAINNRMNGTVVNEPLSAKSLPPSLTSGGSSARPATARATKSLGPTARPKTAAVAPSISDKPSAPAKKSLLPTTASESNFTPNEGITYETAVEQLTQHIGADTIELLNSKKWNEVADAMKSIGDKLSALDNSTIDTAVTAYFYCINKIPSFKASNVNIVKQVYDTTATVGKLATKLSKSCAYLPLNDILSKMSDKKLSDAGTQLLIVLCECVTPKFIVSQILKLNGTDNKNVKAFEAIIQCVNKIVDEFTIGTIDVMELININKQWLSNTNASVKTAALALHTTLYKQGGAALKSLLLADIQPKQLPTIEAEFKKLDDSGSVGQVTATRTVKGADNTAGSTTTFDPLANIPRTDISGKITEALLKKLDDAKWTERKDAIAEINAILNSAAHRITANDNGLTDVLKNRIVDANIVVARETMILIGTLAYDMGKDIKQYASRLLPNIMTQLTNNKAQSDALNALTAWVEHAGFSSIIKYVAKGVTATLARKALCDIITTGLQNTQFTKIEKQELNELIAPLLLCIQDKSKDTRFSAQHALEQLVQYVKYDAIAVEGIQNMKQAEKLALQPFLDKLKQISNDYKSGNKPSTTASNDDSAPAVKRAPSHKAKSTVRPGTSVPTTARQTSKPIVAPVEPSHDTDNTTTQNKLVVKIDNKAKQQRLKLDCKRMKGQFRDWGADEIDELSAQLRTYISDDLYALLYHRDFQKQVSAIEQIIAALQTQFDVVYSISDLLCKWCSSRLHDANTSLLQSILDLLTNLLTQIQQQHEQNPTIVFSEGEASILLPFLVEKIFGHNQPRFRADARKLLKLIAVVYNNVKVYNALQIGLDSKNKRVQSECLEELNEMNQLYGIDIIEYKKFVVQLGSSMVGSTDGTVRKAALDVLATYYLKLGQQLYVILGKNQLGAAGDQVNDKCMSMIEERMKRVKVTDDVSTLAQTELRPKTPTRSKPTSISPEATPVNKRTDTRKQSIQNSGMKRPSTVNKQQIDVVDNTNIQSYDTVTTNVPNCFSLDVGGRQLGARVSFSNTTNRMSRYEPTMSPTSLSYLSTTPTNNTIAQSIQRQITAGTAPDDALKQLWQRIIDTTDRTWLVGQIDSIVDLCITQVDQSFTYENNILQIQHRRATGSINILSELFKSTALPLEVTIQTVEKSLQVFIPLLLNEQFRKSSNNDTKQLLQQCNKFILKFVTDCDPTTSIVALIQQIKLQTYQAIQQGGTDANPPSNKPLIDLLIKCELKTARAVDLNKLHIERLLQAIHEYYELCGLDKDSVQPNPAEVAARKLMRTLLQTLIMHKGNSIIAMLPTTADENSIIRRYTERILYEINNGGTGENAASPHKVAHTTTQPTTATAQHLHATGVTSLDDTALITPIAASNDTDNDAEYLKQLLKQTTDVTQSQQAFQQLADYIQSHPTVDIYQYATDISDSFQQHIKRTVTRIINDKSSQSTQPSTLPSATTTAPVRRPSTSGTTVDDIRRRLAAMQMNTIKQPVSSVTTIPTPTSASIQPIVAPATTPLSAASIPTPTSGSQTSRVTSSTLEAIKQRLAANQGRATLGSVPTPTNAVTAPITTPVVPLVSPLNNTTNTVASTQPVGKSIDLASIKARLSAVRTATSAQNQPIASVQTTQPPQ